MNISYNLLISTRENIKVLECLRENAYQLASLLEEEKYYTEWILSSKFLAYKASYDKEPAFGSLYIDQLFVKYEFQEKGYSFGKNFYLKLYREKKK